MNNPDYDSKKFYADDYGNLTAIEKPVKYNGYTIDQNIGKVKVWDESDNFVGDYPDVESAKTEIDSIASDKK